MKYLFLLLPLIVVAQVPSAPTNLRIATTAVDLPVGSIIPLTVSEFMQCDTGIPGLRKNTPGQLRSSEALNDN